MGRHGHISVAMRGGTLQLYKRVPARYAPIEPRKFVWVSLHTDSPTVADTKASLIWENFIAAWEAKLAGDTSDAEQRFAAAQELAQVRGFRHLNAAAVARLPISQLLDRVDAVRESPKGKVDLKDAAALLGGAAEPSITVSRALDLYWSLAADRAIGKSPDQLRRWKNPRIKAVRNFIEVVGDRPLAEITGEDMLEFRDWWIEKLAAEGLTANSANKDLTHLGDVLKTVNRLKRLGLVLPLSDLSLQAGEATTRPPFSVDWIRTRLLKPDALNGLNREARCLVLGMVNTGYRPSEGAALTAGRIRLDGPVPHISIEPEGRQLKTVHARRVIPLAGISLTAFRECPEGFPRYRDNPSLSATVNKFLRANKLMETPKHVLYSLRHSFEDRMLAAGVDERIRRDLFGHALNRERYGSGASLEHLHKVIQDIAL